MNLIFDYEPGTITFSSYHENTLPNEVLPIYRKLKEDIMRFAIKLYYNGNVIDCYESAAITLHINQDAYECSDWWIDCKLSHDDVKNWLKDNNIKSNFFSIQNTTITNELIELFNTNNKFYSYKLTAAIKAWLYFNEHGIKQNQSPKTNITNWLTENALDLGLIDEEDKAPNKQTLEDIAKVVNWNPKGGAPRSTK